MAELLAGDHRKPCCTVPENLYVFENKPGLVVRKCRVCNCRHFEMTVDPGVYDFKGRNI